MLSKLEMNKTVSIEFDDPTHIPGAARMAPAEATGEAAYAVLAAMNFGATVEHVAVGATKLKNTKQTPHQNGLLFVARQVAATNALGMKPQYDSLVDAMDIWLDVDSATEAACGGNLGIHEVTNSDWYGAVHHATVNLWVATVQLLFERPEINDAIERVAKALITKDKLNGKEFAVALKDDGPKANPA